MQFIKTLSVLAVATGVVVARPTKVEQDLEKRQNDWTQGNKWWHRPAPGAEVTVAGYGNVAPAPTAAAPTVPTTVVVITPEPSPNPAGGGSPYQPAPQPQPTPEPQPQPAPQPQPQQPPTPSQPSPTPDNTPAPSDTPAPSSGDDGDYLSVINNVRGLLGLPAFNKDSSLEANALKTTEDHGGAMVHELNAGTMAQVLAPGEWSDFTSVVIGGWYCEIAYAQLDCSKWTAGWDHSDGETGHAEILSSTSYGSIGCAVSNGLVACDCH